jgi:hypothetical protein
MRASIVCEALNIYLQVTPGGVLAVAEGAGLAAELGIHVVGPRLNVAHYAAFGGV